MTREEVQLKRNVISLEPCFVQDAKMCNLINEIYDEHEAQLKDKDERIKELDCRAYHAEGYISDLHNEYPKHKKFLDAKARSIVAMLFWEWKATKDCTDDEIVVSFSEDVFLKAYKMLKEQ